MSISVFAVASDSTKCEQLAALIPSDTFTITTGDPSGVPAELPNIFVIALPGINTPEEQLIEKLRADDATAGIPIVIVSQLSMVELQSVPYASDWTIAIVEEPVEAQVLVDTMNFLLNPDG